MPPASARFPSTAWSCITAAGDTRHPKHVAVNRLIATYWRPAYSFLRRKYPTAADHEALTQVFFLKLVTKNWVARADEAKGRFRDLLRKILSRFAHDHTVDAAKQTQFEQTFVSIHSLIQDSDRVYDPPADQTPEQAFDQGWRAALLATVRRNLEAHYTTAQEEKERQRYAIFAALHFGDADEKPPTQEAVAARFGVSRDQVAYAVELVKKRYVSLLRQEIRDQVGSEADVEDEIRKLL